MDFRVFDKSGSELVVTTTPMAQSFDTVTCSPHPDGFTVLTGLVGEEISQPQLEEACRQTVARNEVCVLPASVSPRWRVLLTPTIKFTGPASRSVAETLMLDLFRATQHPSVHGVGLLVTHFFRIRRYPADHIQGILDALRSLANDSFGRLRLIGFDFDPAHLERFHEDLRHALHA